MLYYTAVLADLMAESSEAWLIGDSDLFPTTLEYDTNTPAPLLKLEVNKSKEMTSFSLTL